MMMNLIATYTYHYLSFVMFLARKYYMKLLLLPINELQPPGIEETTNAPSRHSTFRIQ